MNPRRYLFKMDIERLQRVGNPATGLETKALVQVFTQIPCLPEPIPAHQLASILAEIEGAELLLNWGTEALQMGDVVILGGERYTLRKINQDIFRSRNPYHTGVLAKRKGTA